MKKIILALAGLAVAAGAYAQADVVKAGERALKEGQEAAKVVEIITPAFTDPATSQMAQTWFIPGKASFAEYDKLLGLRSFNRLPEGGESKMGHLLIDGYDYFMKAFPLDSVPNEKGKVKPKYSKEMLGIIAGHFSDYVNAGADLYNAHDYNGAYRAWGIFTSMPENPELASRINAQPDSVFGEIYFNQGIAAWQGENLENALNAFMNAKSKGYSKKSLYDYAISIASQIGRNDTVLALAEEALPLYGNESDLYIRQIINYYLQARNFDRAFEIINKALEAEPNNAQYYGFRVSFSRTTSRKTRPSKPIRKPPNSTPTAPTVCSTTAACSATKPLLQPTPLPPMPTHIPHMPKRTSFLSSPRLPMCSSALTNPPMQILKAPSQATFSTISRTCTTTSATKTNSTT